MMIILGSTLGLPVFIYLFIFLSIGQWSDSLVDRALGLVGLLVAVRRKGLSFGYVWMILVFWECVFVVYCWECVLAAGLYFLIFAMFFFFFLKCRKHKLMCITLARSKIWQEKINFCVFFWLNQFVCSSPFQFH